MSVPLAYDLHYISQSVMMDLEYDTKRHYQKFLKWAVDGYRRLNLANVIQEGTFKSVMLPINSDKSVDLPADYIDFQKIGLCINGEILTLDLNEDLCLVPNRDACGNTIPTAVQAVTQGDYNYFDYVWTFLSYYHNGQYVAGHYGYGEGFSGGGYRIDPTERRIVLSLETAATEILLEYKCKGISDDGNGYVPEQVIPALSAYVHMVEKRHNRNANAYDKREARRLYGREVKALAHRNQAFNQDMILNVMRKDVHQLPKR